MKRLIAWLKNNDYRFKEVNYGESHYFYNAPGFIYTALQVTISNEDIKAIRQAENKLKKHINNKYDVISESHYWWNYCTNQYDYSITIRTYADKAGSDNYYYFRDKAIEFFEIAQHVYIQMGIIESNRKEFNDLVRAKMDYYGSLYNQSLIKVVSA